MRDNYLEEYYSFLRFPSVSTDDKYKEGLVECANWLVNKLNKIGLQTQLVPTKRHPIVWGRNEHKPGRPTVLIYGHYDVQPPDPLELWDSPPFEPVLKNGYVFARGSTDNKGLILAHILGIQETIEEHRELPVNLHLLIDGDEEIVLASEHESEPRGRFSRTSLKAIVYRFKRQKRSGPLIFTNRHK